MPLESPDPRLKVLFIVKPIRWSGADRVLLEVAAALDPERYRVIYGVITENRPEEEIPLPESASVIRFPMRSLNGTAWVGFFFRLCRALHRSDIQVVHVNSYHPSHYVRLAAWLLRVPVIVDHWHGIARFNRKRRAICRLLQRFTDLSFAVSEQVRDYIVAQCGLNPARFRVLYNCLDCDHYDRPQPAAQVRRELGLPGDLPLVGLVARLDHRAKGHQELFGALALLRERQPFRALIVGGGRRQAEMAQLVTELGIDHLVHFLGNRTDVPRLLAAMDLFVLPSHSEGVSLAVLEAMAAGLPVIVSRVGGLPEIVHDGDTGLLIPPRDVQALAAALKRLLADPDWARSLGQRGRDYVREHFSRDRLRRDINAHYHELTRSLRGGGERAVAL